MATKVHIEMINLAAAKERREKMEAELARAGVSAEFHPAVDRKTATEAEMMQQCKPDGPWGPFHPSNMACTISHARVWERFLASDADVCLAMEDDIFVSPDLGAWLVDLSWWPVDADIVKLERWRGRRLKILMASDGPTHRGRRLRRMFSRHVGSAGYMITRRAAEQFLAARPFDISIDNLLFNFNASATARRMTVYQVTPALCVQGNEPPVTATLNTGPRARPTGMALVRQKLKRGWYEIAYPLPTLVKALTGRAVLEPVAYAADAGGQDA